MAIMRVTPSAGSRNMRPAGAIASRNGSAADAPVPRRKVRRDRCFPVMKFISLHPPLVCGGLRLAHLEQIALYDPEDQVLHLVPLGLRRARDRADGRLV